jgi:hypothetical protein
MLRAANFRTAMGLVLFGIVLWEILVTLPFDWSIISGKRKFKWPMILYFTARLSMFLQCLFLIINSQGSLIVDCNNVTWVLKITDATAIWSSSTLLVMRALAVWSKDRRMIVLFVILGMGLIVTYCLTWRPSDAFWDGKQCQMARTSPNDILLAEFLYTFAFDFVVTVAATIKLWQWRGQSGISDILLRDGLAYFIFASAGNLLQAIFPALRLNPIWNITFLPVALSISVIAATRVFSNLIIAHDALIDPALSARMTKGNSTAAGTWKARKFFSTNATEVDGVYSVATVKVESSTYMDDKTEQV